MSLKDFAQKDAAIIEMLRAAIAEGVPAPSLKTMAGKLNSSKGSIQSAIRRMMRRGELTQQRDGDTFRYALADGAVTSPYQLVGIARDCSARGRLERQALKLKGQADRRADAEADVIETMRRTMRPEAFERAMARRQWEKTGLDPDVIITPGVPDEPKKKRGRKARFVQGLNASLTNRERKRKAAKG